MTHMSAVRVNYDQIASTYHQRYAVNRLEGVAAALKSLVQQVHAERVLEVGCGTGRWLVELQSVVPWVYGLDWSPGMLRQARRQPGQLALTCGQANRLPFSDATFELVFCVNALHHFEHPHAFVAETRRLLRPGGILAIIGLDPHSGRDQWYLYNYFESTYEVDLRRFPSWDAVRAWMDTAGFEHVTWHLAERIVQHYVGRAVLDDPFLQKYSTSQLALLTDEAYAAGRERLEAALAAAETRQETLTFPVDLTLAMVTGQVQTS
jgi:ubiquinone/menaquinone biosynthesis C-methylase UbiE